MSNFKQISLENKEKLMGLVSKVANYVKGGMDPTDALTKAASDVDCPTDYILRASEAYNGAAHLSYFKQASRDERGNSFPLADGYEAIRRVMGKVAAQSVTVDQDDLAYVKESNSYFDSGIEDSFLFSEKQATSPSLDSLIKQANAIESKENLAIANSRLSYNQACESLAQDIKAFRNKTANYTHHRRSHWAKESLERHGKEALDVISLATGVTGSDCEKLAQDKVGYYSLGESYLSDLDAIVRSYNLTSMLHEKIASTEANHFVNKVERKNLLNEACGYTKKSFNPFGVIQDAATSQSPFLGIEDAPANTSIQRSAIEALADPKYLSQSKNIEKALLLNELIKQDEIISKHPANDINMALDEIYAIAPTAAEYKPLMRAMLRKRLESGEQIDDFSLNQMVAMDEKMRENTKELRIAPKLIGTEDSQRSIYG